jgi:hypothetical protein
MGSPEILQPFPLRRRRPNGCRFVTNGISHSATEMFSLNSLQRNGFLGGCLFAAVPRSFVVRGLRFHGNVAEPGCGFAVVGEGGGRFGGPAVFGGVGGSRGVGS